MKRLVILAVIVAVAVFVLLGVSGCSGPYCPAPNIPANGKCYPPTYG